MINFILGGSGTGKSYKILENINLQIEKNVSPLIIIPDQFSFEFDKMLYQKLGLKKYNQADALSFSRLAEFIFLKYGGRPGEYADDLTKAAVMYQTVETLNKNNSLNFFKRQSGKADFTEYALQIIEELKKADISSQELYEKTSAINGQVRQKAEDIALIYTIYDDILAKNKLKDKLNDIALAAGIASEYGFFNGMTIFIDEFDGFTGDEIQMLEIIFAQAENIFITLRTENEYHENSGISLFSENKKTYSVLCGFAKKYNVSYRNIIMDKYYRFSSDAVCHVIRNIFRKKMPLQSDNSEGFTIIEAKDFYQETEFVCSEICRLIKDEKYNFSDIAVVARFPEEYAGIIEACFKRYHIPYFMDIEKSVMHTSIMLMISSLLEIISSKKPSTETILKYAKTQLLGINYENISALENYCYKWEVEGYTWHEPFTADENCEMIESIRKKLIEPILKLRKECINSTGLQICTAIYNYLEEMQIPRNISGLAEEYNNNGHEYMAKELKRLWGCLIDILDVTANILHDVKITPARFSGLISSMLRQNKYSNPPHSIDAVSVSAAQRTRLSKPKAVFAIGVNEGIFPGISAQNGLLSASDKDILAENGIEISRNPSELIMNEKFIFYRTASAASHRLYISYPLSDVTGASRFPSSIIRNIENMFNVNVKKYASQFSSIFYSPTPEAAYYNYVQHFNSQNQETSDIEKILDSIPVYHSKIDYLKSINCNYDFHIENKELIRKSLSSRFHISATKFETYNLCHFRFFCHDILKIYSRDRKNINPLETGNIIHLCLENILSSCHTKDELMNLSAEKIKFIISSSMKKYREDKLGGNFAKSARFEANYNKIKNTAFEIAVHLQEELLQSEFLPVNYELKISEKDGDTPIKIITPQGIEVILSGKIDRVDLLEKDGQKYIRIIDYKSRNKDFSIGNLLYGIDMQMFLYLFSVIAEKGRHKNSIPAGVLYLPYSITECIKKNGLTVSDIKNKNYKMKGVVLQNRIVLNAMEKDIQGIYIPASVTSKDKGSGDLILDNRYSSCLNEKQFRNLKIFIENLISEMTDNLYSGDISANPFKCSSADACKYCDYSDVCGNASELRSRSMDKDAEKQIKELLNQDEN